MNARQVGLMRMLVDEWLNEYGELSSYAELAREVRDLRDTLAAASA